ncbi:MULTISPECIES: hypothetical protein [unclassified Bradyrhizobium]|uniref:hypothetical protein n=1 Tax=Bradyrhizobium sp. USDA 4541 TaxID=2817704 RepID=UPI0020A37F31|nr:hypothetical protein [Bradyrhizobium sp. USDA 4541]MCP1852801.1 hypothetical protein [Bradyrhizobium sp. USDA 4541]
MDDKVNITFDQTRVVDNEHAGTANETRFEEGKTYPLSPRSADRWVKRGVAHFTTEDDAVKARGASSDVALKLQDADRQDPNASRRQPEGTGGKDNADDGDLSKKTVAELQAIAAERKVDISGLTKKADIVAALENDAKVKAAIEAGNFDELTVPELQKLAADKNIDLGGKTAKADIVEAVKAGSAPAAAS